MSLRSELKKIDDDLNLSEGGQSVGAFLNDWSEDWIERPLNLVEEFFKDLEDYAKDPRPRLDKLMGERILKIPNILDAPNLDAARRNAQSVRRRGRAASILSERPTDPLGYTGGGVAASNILLGA